VRLIGCIIRIYHFARSAERQITKVCQIQLLVIQFKISYIYFLVLKSHVQNP